MFKLTTTFFAPRLGALATAALLAAGCGSSGSAKPDSGSPDGGSPDGGGDGAVACTTGGTGMIKIAVAGLPDGAMPMVQLTGGGLTSPKTLAIGTPVSVDARGGYEIFYRRFKTAPATGSVVGNAYYISATDFTGCIKSGETTNVTLTYTKEPGSGKLWVTAVNPPPPAGRVFAAFDGTAVATSGAKTPSVWRSKNFTGRAAAGAFDSFGNLWMTGGDRINGYAMETLGTSSDAAPTITLTQPANTSAKFAAFDELGNLYVSRGAPGTKSEIVRYASTDLEASGSPAGAIISSPDMANPAGLAFDKFGDLWVASEENDKVLKFTRAHVNAAYAGPADIVITAKSGGAVVAPYTSPIGLAFDKDGNLWVGYSSTTVKITSAQQAASGELNAPFALELATGTGGFAFDESGGLWCPGPPIGSPSGEHTFQRIPSTALGTAGAVTPDILIDSAELGGAETIVLDPAPTWSPIHDWL